MVPADASHAQTEPNGDVVQFTQVSGNEWWVQVRMAGPDGASASSVGAMDTGGPWVPLQAQTWTSDHTWWAASFHLEPGHQVLFRASFPDGVSNFQSCWFDHPSGVERCSSPSPSPSPSTSTSPPPSPSGSVLFTQVGGNEWWVQVRLAGSAGPSATSVRAMDTDGPWIPLQAQTWTSDHTWWAASFHLEPGHQVRFEATVPGMAVQQSCWFDHPSGTERCGSQPPSPPPPPPPPPASSSKEAEAFGVRTAGGRQADGQASAGAAWNLWSNGYIQDTLDVGTSGSLGVVARGQPLGGVWPVMMVSIDGSVTRTVSVSSAAYATYPVADLSPGTHTVRITFTNDASSSTEDRNLILDRVGVANGGAQGGGPWVLTAGQTATWSSDWPGGPGHFVVDAATAPDLNLRPSLRIESNGALLRQGAVAGPVARPAWAAFDLPQGPQTFTFTAVGGTVTLSGASVSAAPPATSLTGAAARIHQGGAAEGNGWRFTDYGSLDSRLVVMQSGWYLVRVQGVGTVNDVGPLVHLNLNRTVVAEGVQGTTIDLSARHYLVAGVGYTLGASFENPWPSRTARFDTLSATPSDPLAALPSAVHVDAVDNPSGWRQYGRDSYNSRSSHDAALPAVATANSLHLKWRANVDGSVTGTPVVVDGRVFVGTWAKSLYALDETTGAVLWRVNLPNTVDGSVAVSQGKVVVSVVSTVMAFDAATGAQSWTTSNLGGHTWSSPTIDGDAVFIGLGVGRGYVVRLDLANGAIVWMTPTANDINGGARVWASPLVPPGSELVVVGTSPGSISGGAEGQGPTIDSLLAYDRETGVLRWAHQFFPRDQNLESSPEETLLTNRDISGTPHLAFIDGRPVVLASQKHGPAWIVDLTDGSLVSGSRLLESRTALIGSGGVADGIRVVSSAEPDRIAAFDLVTGDLLWQHTMPATEFAPVAIANGVVWVGSWEGHLHAFDLRTGRELAQLDAGGGVFGGASLADGKVFVGALQKTANFSDSLGKLPGSVSAWEA
ncbi:MAG: hypothetical protein QOC71_577 [Thermoplasmata archaeon]|nr:hypothetical protein [Thermoplasmata archaeon]